MTREISVAQSASGTWHRTGQDACEWFAVAADVAEKRRIPHTDVGDLPGDLCSYCFRVGPDGGDGSGVNEGESEDGTGVPTDPEVQPTALAETVDGYLSDPPVALSDPLTAITGLSDRVAEQYADPAATESYFGRATAVETVGQLLCSDASIRGVNHTWKREARRDLLAVPFGPDAVAEVVEDYRETHGSLDRLFGADAPAEFDPREMTDREAALLRHCTAFGYRVTPDDVPRPTAATIVEDRVRDETYQHLSLYRRSSFDVLDVPLSTLSNPALVTPALETSRDDVVLLSTARDPRTLTGDDVDAYRTTHLRADLLVTASLLLRTNFARPENWSRIHFRPADEAELAEGESEIYCVFEPVDGPYHYGISTPLDGDLAYRTVARLVREQVP